MSTGDGRSRVRPHRADAHGVSGGSPALLAAVCHGGELRGFAGIQGATGVGQLASGDETTPAFHRENLEHRHRRLSSLCAETLVGMAHVSHVRHTINTYVSL